MTIGDLLHSTATRIPRKTALIEDAETMSYEAFDQSSTRLAQWLVAQGLQPGDRIAIHWPNSIATAQLFFAVFKAGLIAVPVNLRLKTPEIAYIFDHSQPAMCFSELSLAHLVKAAAAGCPSVRSVFTQLPTEDVTSALPEIDSDQPAVIMYTSGTTARPKGVTHSHRTLIAGLNWVVGDLVEGEDTAVTFTQMMHATGLWAVLLPSVMTGATVVTLAQFSPAAVLDAIERYRCTYLLSLPALVQFVAEEQARKPRDVSSVRTIAAGGDTVPVALQERVRELFGVPVREGYGMTECFPITFNSRDAIRQGSIGRASAGIDLRIVNLSGGDVADGEIGEVVVRSPSSCLGYWNDAKATADLFKDGWLHTGDLASRDSDGFYRFQGRLKQIIIRAGSNISPQEVEEALYRHPAVIEAGVIGQPDDTYGELPVACVVLRSAGSIDEQELRNFAREYLADYKVPERIVFFHELPKGLSGKVDRRGLKEMLLAGMQRAASAA